MLNMLSWLLFLYFFQRSLFPCFNFLNYFYTSVYIYYTCGLDLLGLLLLYRSVLEGYYIPVNVHRAVSMYIELSVQMVIFMYYI